MHHLSEAPVPKGHGAAENPDQRSSVGLHLQDVSETNGHRSGPGRNGVHCPRCFNRLIANYGDLVCVVHGTMIYADDPVHYQGRNDAMVARYQGKERHLREVTVICRRQPRAVSVYLTPQCPWCGRNMNIANYSPQHSQSDGRWYFKRSPKAPRFGCVQGHRIWVWTGNHGMLYWE